METSYTFEPEDEGRTRIEPRTRGEPRGFSRLLIPFMTAAMRRANRDDLTILQKNLEGR